WLTLENWSKIYGPIWTLWIGRRPQIIVADPLIAAELMARRGSKYSSRPRSIVFGEIFSQGSSIGMKPYGHSLIWLKWSVCRKLLHNSLKTSMLPVYKPRQEAEAMIFLAGVFANTEFWSKAIDRFAASVVFSLAYGRRIDNLDSKVLQTRKRLFAIASSCLAPGAYLVESLPFLLHLPDCLSKWKEYPRRTGQEAAEFDISLVDSVQKELREKAREVPVSLTKNMLAHQEKGEARIETLSERHFAALPATLYGAGFDTTAATIHSAILALLVHPRVQRAARAEIDAVVGRERTPTFEDQAKLPYIDALIKETMRWRPAAVFGLPHTLSEDDVYDGYRFARGTTFWATAWAINQNAEYFPSPETFAPERYLEPSDPRYDAQIAVKPFPGPWGHGTFGWGRRVCVGADLAVNNIWIVLAKLVWAFEITPIEGTAYDVDDYVGSSVLKPAPFSCHLVVRGEQTGEIIGRELKGVEKVLETFPAFD
ncbi:cytochrome P450, partial [Diplocarpon rosae]